MILALNVQGNVTIAKFGCAPDCCFFGDCIPQKCEVILNAFNDQRLRLNLLSLGTQARCVGCVVVANIAPCALGGKSGSRALPRMGPGHQADR